MYRTIRFFHRLGVLAWSRLRPLAVVIALSAGAATPVQAQPVNCEVEIEAVFISLNNSSVWICLKDDGVGCVYKYAPRDANEAQLDRMLSLAQTAISTGAPVQVRFDTSDGNCPTVEGLRTTFDGIYLFATDES